MSTPGVGEKECRATGSGSEEWYATTLLSSDPVAMYPSAVTLSPTKFFSLACPADNHDSRLSPRYETRSGKQNCKKFSCLINEFS